MNIKFPITVKGIEDLREELRKLCTIERSAVINAIAEARGHGDLSENAEYHAAREKQSFLEARISELEDKAARAEVIDVSKLSGDTVKFGAKILLLDLDTDEKVTYRILGEYEANLEQGLLSISSPLARALIGKTQGDIIEVSTPKGSKAYEILKIEY